MMNNRCGGRSNVKLGYEAVYRFEFPEPRGAVQINGEITDELNIDMFNAEMFCGIDNTKMTEMIKLG